MNANKMGRPPIAITPEICNQAAGLAARGLSQKQIALSLGMGRSTLYEKLSDFPDFLDAIRGGQAKGVAEISNSLYTEAKKGDVPACKYYLNNRDPEHWRDRREVTGPGGEALDLTWQINVVEPSHEG